jgi:hypothetical protein
MSRPARRDWRRLTVLAAGAAGIALSCGCASRPDLVERSRIEAGSPVAAAIVEAKANPGPAPTFADIPKAPTDMRPGSSWAAPSSALQSEGQKLAAAAQMPVEISDPDALSKRLRAQSGLDAISAPAVSATPELEAQAREMRERATPPPPPK